LNLLVLSPENMTNCWFNCSFVQLQVLNFCFYRSCLSQYLDCFTPSPMITVLFLWRCSDSRRELNTIQILPFYLLGSSHCAVNALFLLPGTRQIQFHLITGKLISGQSSHTIGKQKRGGIGGSYGVQTNKGRPPFCLVWVWCLLLSFKCLQNARKNNKQLRLVSHCFLLHLQIANSVNPLRLAVSQTICVYLPR